MNFAAALKVCGNRSMNDEKNVRIGARGKLVGGWSMSVIVQAYTNKYGGARRLSVGTPPVGSTSQQQLLDRICTPLKTDVAIEFPERLAATVQLTDTVLIGTNVSADG